MGQTLHDETDDLDIGPSAADGSSPPTFLFHTEMDPLRDVVSTVIGALEVTDVPEIVRCLAEVPRTPNVIDLRPASGSDDVFAELIGALPPHDGRRIILSRKVVGRWRDQPPGAEIEADPDPLHVYVHRAQFGVSIHDGDLRFRYVNDWLARLHGLSPMAHYGYRPDELFEPDQEGALAVMRRVVETGSVQWRAVDADVDGRRGRFACWWCPVDMDGGTGVLATVSPLDSVTPVERRLEMALDRPAESERLDGARAAQPVPVPQLTQREREVLERLADGLTNSEIADDLFLSIDTVKTYCKRLYRKLGVRNRAHAVATAQDLVIDVSDRRR